MNPTEYQVKKLDEHTRARTGILRTLHGAIHTPAYSPVGTKATVKGILPATLRELGTEIVLANTYHLYLQPGERLIQNAGGIGRFMGWEGPTITDSGGFQVFSLGVAYGKGVSKIAAERTAEEALTIYDEQIAGQHGQLAIVDDEGVTFTSHIDGSLHRFTPERSVEIQHALGADIFFAFDECTAPNAPYEYQREAMDRTHRWAQRSLEAHRQNIAARKKQAIYGIVQGGRYADLRADSAREIGEMGFDGIGIGGSFSRRDMGESLRAAVDVLPSELPRHFLGIGEPGDILNGIAEGMDLFDCVAATRLGRHGTIYTRNGLLHLSNEQCRTDHTPLREHALTPLTSSMPDISVAYLAHLIRSKEMLGGVLASMHNIKFILDLFAGAREAIENNTFDVYRDLFMSSYYKSRGR